MTDLSQTSITFCHIFSLITSIVNLIFYFLFLFIFFKSKQRSAMMIFSLQLSISPLTNSLSYLIPYRNPSSFEVDFICRLQCILHIVSLILCSNMLFIYYLLNFIIFINPVLANSKFLQIIVHSVNWIIMVGFIIFNGAQTPILGKLRLCRYDTATIGPTVNASYIGIISVFTIVLFILIICNIKKSIKTMDDDNEINNYKGIVRYIFLIVVMMLIKCFSYFAKEGKTLDVLYVIDRVWENLSAMFIITFICIGKRGFGMLFCERKDKNRDTLGITEMIKNEDDEINDSFN